METPKIFACEYKLAELVWHREPLSVKELTVLAEKELSWKRTTAYTQLKRLCERGILKNEDGMVTSLVGRDAVRISEGRELLNRMFSGSLADMVQAFTGGKAITKEEADEIRKLIDRYEEAGK